MLRSRIFPRFVFWTFDFRDFLGVETENRAFVLKNRVLFLETVIFTDFSVLDLGYFRDQISEIRRKWEICLRYFRDPGAKFSDPTGVNLGNIRKKISVIFSMGIVDH